MSGLALGVAALIVVLAVFNGFEHEVRHRLLQVNAHVIASVYPAGLKDPSRWIEALYDDRELGAEWSAMSPFIHTESLAKQGSSLVGIIVRGIDPERQNKVQSLEGLIRPSEAASALQKEIVDASLNLALPEIPSVILGYGLLKTLNVKIGDTISLVTPKIDSLAVTKNYKIIGTYHSGLKQYDDRLAILSLPTAQAFTGMGDKVTGLAIGLKDGDRSDEVAELLARRYSALTVKEWQSLNARFFELMETERFRVGLIVALVGLVAGFNILTTVIVSVSQRQREISIMKALGARTRQIMQVFLLQSAAIGVLGALLGVILASIVAYILRTFPFLELPDPYFLKTLPVQTSFSLMLLISLAAIALCLVAGLYPAWIASRVTPTEGLKGGGKAE